MSTERISQFDGLRALAFFAVFLHHGVHAPLLWMGVDMFFVLSGFLITRNLLALRDSSTMKSSIAAFYFRRVLRIVPPYYLALAMIVAVSPVLVSEMPWFLGFTSNIRDAIANKPIEGPLNPMWSIAVEEQFYLLWPWLVLLLPRRRLGLAFVAVIVAAPLFRVGFSTFGFNAVYRLMLCRMDLLGAGALLALIDARSSQWFTANRKIFAIVGALAIAGFAALSLRFASFRTSHNDLLFDVVGFGLSTVFFSATLALVRGTNTGPVASILRHPVLTYLGKISYMAYLTHMLALTVVARLHLGLIPTAVIALIVTVGVSSISWYAIEAPLGRLRRYVLPRARLRATP